jgi:ribosomal protein S17
MSEEKKVQRTVNGRVVSAKMDKTVSVAIEHSSYIEGACA